MLKESKQTIERMKQLAETRESNLRQDQCKIRLEEVQKVKEQMSLQKMLFSKNEETLRREKDLLQQEID